MANRDLNALTPEMKKRVERWLKKCAEHGIDILITEGRRSQARQKFLYSFGRYGINRTKAKVTWTMKSNHLTGNAIDFGFLDNGKFHYNGPWDTCYDIAEKVGLKSLYRKYKTDRPHLEFDEEWNDDTPEWARDSMKYLDKKKIMSNKRPNDPITRAEIAVVAHRIIKHLTK